MASVQAATAPRPPPFGHTSPARPATARHHAHSTTSSSAATASPTDAANAEPASSSSAPPLAHTLTACSRCRQRKTRCDPGLPRCGPCERTNSICEYYDANKGHNVNRNYVVYLQHKVQELEEELERIENEDAGEDPDAMVHAATVRVHEATDSKYLGPASGIAISRLVMQLAKQFTDAKSIKEIVPEQRARQIRDLFHQEHAKPTSKVYPLISDVAADELPNRTLTDLLLQLYKLRVQSMYPCLYEPALDRDIEAVYDRPRKASPYQHFVCRMVLAISLQKMDTQYAGLADSYYLAALKFLEPVVRPMDLRTLQCFALMAQYSLLTPTRTAIYYVVGIGVRLAQALGFNEEKTIQRGRGDAKADCLEVDLRRRVFWCIMVMEFGLAHSLGRPAILATSREHIDVHWFETCDDHYITPDGIDPAAPRPTLKKWICIHFFQMRLLQLEIRRKLYQRKRPEPVDDQDPWFKQMDAKLCAWRDASPHSGEDIGLDKVWFVGRYHTMIVFLYRPSPQIPRPSLDAALKCFDACEFNMYMQRQQISKRNVDLTWIFTQSIFMCINTMLWSLSYVEVRRRHSRATVEKHLNVAMDAVQLASERWPGVASALQLYTSLINAILKIYEKDGDVPISTATPSDVPSPNQAFSDSQNRSQTTSPATVSSASVPTPDERPSVKYLPHQARRSVEQPPPVPYQSDAHPASYPAAAPQMSPPTAAVPVRPHSNGAGAGGPNVPHPPAAPAAAQSHVSPASAPPAPPPAAPPQAPSPAHGLLFDPRSYANPLPQWMPDLTVPAWTAPPAPQLPFVSATHMPGAPFNHPLYGPGPGPGPGGYAHPAFDPTSQTYPFPAAADPSAPPMMPADPWANHQWDMDAGGFGSGLNLDQQQELMQSLETQGMEDIQTMIGQTMMTFAPKTAR